MVLKKEFTQVGEVEKVSIIIPVYNVEKFIVECVRSLLKQTHDNFEAIFVDDGSQDKSISLVEGLVKDDNRFTIVKKENGGLSSARNYGLKFITSKFVSFLDSDDFLSENYIEVMLSSIGESDICSCGYNEISEDGGLIRNVLNIDNRSNSAKDYGKIIESIDFIPNAWGKLYRSTVFDKLEYPEGMLFEDFSIVYKLFYNQSYVFVNKPLYNYRIRSGSIMRNYNPKIISDKLTIINEMKDFLISKGIYERYNSSFNSSYIFHGVFVTSCILINQTSCGLNKNIKYFFCNVDKEIFTIPNIIALKPVSVSIKVFLFLLLVHPSLGVLMKKIQNKIRRK